MALVGLVPPTGVHPTIGTPVPDSGSANAVRRHSRLGSRARPTTRFFQAVRIPLTLPTATRVPARTRFVRDNHATQQEEPGREH